MESEKKKKALEWLKEDAEGFEFKPCLNCGRVMLAGRCCDSPRFEEKKDAAMVQR